MSRARKYSEELLERATRLVFESGRPIAARCFSPRRYPRHGRCTKSPANGWSGRYAVFSSAATPDDDSP
jgi:hypothetical protein